jgi:hypothetical protein
VANDEEGRLRLGISRHGLFREEFRRESLLPGPVDRGSLDFGDPLLFAASN